MAPSSTAQDARTGAGAPRRIALEGAGVRLSALLAEPADGAPRAAVVALHGSGMNAAYFHARADPRLSLLALGPRLGYTVLALDRPGYGRSASAVLDGQRLAEQTRTVRAALAVVVAVVPGERRGRALALFFGLTGALTALGPLLGGWLTSWTWRAIFWVNVPVAIIALILTAVAHISDRRRPESLDVKGAVLIAVGMGASVLGFQQASAWGWDSVATWACIVGGLAVLYVFCRYELRTRHPLVNLAVFRDRAFTVDSLVLFFAMLAFVPLFFFASVYAQVSLSASPNQAALYLLYFFVGFAIASQWGGRILDKRGARPAMKTGCVVGAVGFALWAGKLTDLSMHDQWPYAALAGAGIGFILAPASTDAVNRAIDASYGEVTGITQTVRNYAASVGMAVFGTMLTHTMTDKVVDTLQERGVSSATANSVARDVTEAVTGNADARTPTGDSPAATAMRDAMSSIRMDFAEANQWVFYGMAIALGIGFLCALRHPGGAGTQTAADESANAPAPQAPSPSPAPTSPTSPTSPKG